MQLRCIGGGFETLRSCQVGRWVPESVAQSRSGLCVPSVQRRQWELCAQKGGSRLDSKSPTAQADFFTPFHMLARPPALRCPWVSRFPDSPLSQGLLGHWEVTPGSLCSSGAVRCLTHSWSRITGKSHSCSLLYFRKCIIVLFGGR